MGTRVRIIAGTAHQLVVERSYIHKVPIYASLQIAPKRGFFAIHPICNKLSQAYGTHYLLDNLYEAARELRPLFLLLNLGNW